MPPPSVSRFSGMETGWSGKRDSNPRPRAWKARALPLSYSRIPRRITRTKQRSQPSEWPFPFGCSRPENLGLPLIIHMVVGRGGFEPPKACASRFTVCPRWPLGYLPAFGQRTERRTNGKASALRDHFSTPILRGAGERIRTPDPLITNQLLYLLSYASRNPL